MPAEFIENTDPFFTHYGDEDTRTVHDEAFHHGLRFGVAVGLNEQEETITNAVDSMRYVLRERTRVHNRDPITGLLDYRGIEEAYQTLIRQQKRYFSDRESSLLYIDVDRLSDLNKKLSHPGADVLLRDMAEVFQKNVRVDDIVGRHAGDQFIIILTASPLDKATAKAEEIRQKVSQIERDAVHPTITVAVDRVVPEYPLEEIFVKASNAILDSKHRNKRNRVVVVDQKLFPKTGL